MPDTRILQNPYPRGQGLASVPVLFSLPNVQPVIAAANTAVTSEVALDPRPGVPARESGNPAAGTAHESTLSAGARPSDTGLQAPTTLQAAPSTSPSPSSVKAQRTNIAIGVLLVAVVLLGLRNYHASPTTGKSQPVSETSLVRSSEVEIPPPAAVTSLPTPQIPVFAEAFTEPEARESGLRFAEPPPSAALQPPSGALSHTSQESKRLELTETIAPPTAVPLLLPSSPSQGDGLQASADENIDIGTDASGPYGTKSTSAPVSLTSSAPRLPTPDAPVAYNAPPANTFSPEAIDTETPTLNTRDMILMRSGQRPTGSSPAVPHGGGASDDHSLPRIESLSNRSRSGAGSSVLSGQSYPPVRPQYEPISMSPSGGSGSASLAPLAFPSDATSGARNRYQPVGPAPEVTDRIQQPTLPPTSTPISASPSASTPLTSPTLPYTPLSPQLPSPNDGGASGINFPLPPKLP